MQLGESKATLDKRSMDLRRKVVDTMRTAGRGHIPSAFSLIEIMRVLYDSILRYDPANPKMEGRDKLILSKGHGCLAQYVLLEDKGFITQKDLDQFCKFEGILGGHPTYKIPGVEFSTGSLGHGLPVALGFALNSKLSNKKNMNYVVVGDGEVNEGSVWEAALIASKYKLDNLVVIVDYNKQQSYGDTTEVLNLEPFADKWRSFGFEVKEADGHDAKEVETILKGLPFAAGKPNVLICHTIKGRGISFVEKNLSWHHKSKLTDEEVKSCSDELEGKDTE